MCTYAYVHLVIGFFLLCAFGTPWANFSAALPEKVWQCHNATVWYEHYSDGIG